MVFDFVCVRMLWVIGVVCLSACGFLRLGVDSPLRTVSPCMGVGVVFASGAGLAAVSDPEVPGSIGCTEKGGYGGVCVF